jgi:hypothetical protein
MRWLCRKKLMSPNLPMIFATPENQSYEYIGKPQTLISVLKEIPAYQLDTNHRHCGIRGKMLEILQYLEIMIETPMQVGICWFCWKNAKRDAVSWGAGNSKSKADKGSVYRDIMALCHTLKYCNTEDRIAMLRKPPEHHKNQCSHADTHILYANVFGPDGW